MAIDSKHPKYADYKKLYWVKCLDLYKGEETVKEKGIEYLPPTPGHTADGMGIGQDGLANYLSYKERAPVPDYYKEAIETYTGMMHEKPATIELPDSMKYLLESATPSGESLQALLRRINVNQLVSGRLGLFCDLPDSPQTEPRFYISVYDELSIINWDTSSDHRNKDELDLIVLDETADVCDEDLEWKRKERYRKIELIDGTCVVTLYEEKTELAPTLIKVRNQSLPFIPFTFINANDCEAAPDLPPLIGLARLCYTIYKGEADYRHTLFLQGQDTLVVIGGISGNGDEVRVGAGARIDLDTSGDAKYIGVSSAGLPEQRTALVFDHQRAAQMAGKLSNNNKSSQESGEALKTRVAAQTATLNSIAKTGALGLQSALRHIARAIGEDETKVVVKPNLEFAALNLQGDDLVKLMTAKSQGAPLSLKSIHALCQDRGLTLMEFDAEVKEIESEPKLAVVPADATKTKAAGVDSQAKPSA